MMVCLCVVLGMWFVIGLLMMVKLLLEIVVCRLMWRFVFFVMLVLTVCLICWVVSMRCSLRDWLVCAMLIRLLMKFGSCCFIFVNLLIMMSRCGRVGRLGCVCCVVW